MALRIKKHLDIGMCCVLNLYECNNGIEHKLLNEMTCSRLWFLYLCLTEYELACYNRFLGEEPRLIQHGLETVGAHCKQQVSEESVY